MVSATPLVRPRGNAGTGQLVALQDIDAIVLGDAQDCTEAMLDIFARVLRAAKVSEHFTVPQRWQ